MERLAVLQVHRLTVSDGVVVAITGSLILAPNPCTTEPCLPGMALAIHSDGRLLFLTSSGAFRTTTTAWAEAEIEPGAVVTVRGVVRERRDVAGRPYLTIEVSSLALAEG